MPDNVDISEQIRTILSNPIVSISANVEEKYIITTEDKVRILYDEYNNTRKISSDYLSWLGIFLSLFIADVTCTFNDFWFIDATTVKAMFYIATLIFLFLAIRSKIIFYRNKEKLTFSYFLKTIKGTTIK